MTVPDERPTEDRLDWRTVNDQGLLLLQFFLNVIILKAHAAQIGINTDTFKTLLQCNHFKNIIYAAIFCKAVFNSFQLQMVNY